MNGKTDRASEIMKQMEFIEQLTQKLNRAIYLTVEKNSIAMNRKTSARTASTRYANTAVTK